MLVLGLVFNIVVILFIIISCLLIYSLLMNSIERKILDNGILRLLGLNNDFYTGIDFRFAKRVAGLLCVDPDDMGYIQILDKLLSQLS